MNAKTTKEILDFLELKEFDVVKIHKTNIVGIIIGDDIYCLDKCHNTIFKSLLGVRDLIDGFDVLTSKYLGSKNCCEIKCADCPLYSFRCGGITFKTLFSILNSDIFKDDDELKYIILKRLFVEVE